MKTVLLILISLMPLFSAQADLRCSDVLSTSGDAVRLVDTHSLDGADINATIGFSSPEEKLLGLLVCKQLLNQITCSESDFRLELKGSNKGDLNVIQFSKVPGNKSYEFSNLRNGELFESHQKCESVRAKMISTGIKIYRDQAVAEDISKSLNSVSKPARCQP